MTLIDRETLGLLEPAVASLGAGLLLADLLLRRLGRPHSLARVRDGLLACSGLVAALCWCGFLQFEDAPALRWVHMSDSFHYYMGPKYFRELGYTGLYECAARAEQELGAGAEVARRNYRRLATNQFITGREALVAGRVCRERFSPERWRVFVHDVDWFRSRIPWWEATMHDWGYNASPVWNAVGAWLAGSGPVTERRIAALTLLDVPVLLATFGMIAWAFGWRTMCVTLIFWGTHPANSYSWTGGSILRQEWLLASVAGVCLLKKGMPLGAGAALAYATALSVFPGFLAAGIGAKALARQLTERRLVLAPEHRRLLLGAAIALAVALPAAAAGGGGPSAWLGFAVNSRIDSQPSPNNVGLPTLITFQRDATLRELADGVRGVEAWTAERREARLRRAPLWLALVGAWGVLAVGALRRHPDWVAALLGLGFVVFAFELSCYYYAFMLLFGVLWPRHRSIGIALCGLAAAAHGINARWTDGEEQSALLSLLAVAFVSWTTVVLRFSRDEGQEPLVSPAHG